MGTVFNRSRNTAPVLNLTRQFFSQGSLLYQRKAMDKWRSILGRKSSKSVRELASARSQQQLSVILATMKAKVLIVDNCEAQTDVHVSVTD